MRSWLGKLLLAVASVLVTLLVADLVLLIVFGPVRGVENFYEPDARFGYRMRPNLEFVFASPYHGYRATVRTNSLGLRDDEVRTPKPAGVFRILFLGDSMTAGLEVPKDETFEAVCERLLRQHRPTEVVNAGVRGYNLDNIVGFLREVGLSLEPDLVVYFFTDNDLTTVADYHPQGADISRGFTIAGLRGRVAAYSHITYRLEILRQRLEMRRRRDRGERPGDLATVPGGLVSFFTHSDYDSIGGFVLTARRIEQLYDLCAARRIPFWLGAAPQREEVDPESQRWLAAQLAAENATLDFDGESRYLDWVARRLGCARFDPILAFRSRLALEKDFWFHKDGHMNSRGHRFAGELLAEKIAALPAFGASRPQ